MLGAVTAELIYVFLNQLHDQQLILNLKIRTGFFREQTLSERSSALFLKKYVVCKLKRAFPPTLHSGRVELLCCTQQKQKYVFHT